MQIIKEIYLDFYQTEPVLVTAKQGDNARFVKATLLDHGNLFPVPDGTTANLARDEVWNACIVNTDGTVLAPITPDMQPGRLPAEIELYLGTEKLSTWNFILVIQPSARNDSAIEGTNEYTQLDILVNQAREEISNAQTATESANAAALNANESAALANTAASNANVAASSAETNADLAMKAAISALDGKEAATSAATSANAAADRANEAAGNIEQANIKPLAYSVSGESITAGNSAEKPLIGLTVHGRADQVSTTGKNLFDVDSWEILDKQSDGSYKTNQATTQNNLQIDIPVGVYTLSYDCKSDADSNARLRVVYEDGTTGATVLPSNGTYVHFNYITEDKKISSIGTDFSRYGSGIELKNIQLESGSTETSYEPYTGGAPSPSVEYPQAIDIAGIDGNININLMGYNLWDGTEQEDVTGYTTGMIPWDGGDRVHILFGGNTDNADGELVCSIDYYEQVDKKVGANAMSVKTGTTYTQVKFTATGINAGGIGKNVDIKTVKYIVVAIKPFNNTATKISFKNVVISSSADTVFVGYTPSILNVIATPNGLPAVPVSAGGNYTDENGQQWICDEIVRNERGTGKRIQRIGIIESYASETINTAYMSTTGQLTEGATVLYVLDDVIETDLSAEEIAALSALHTYYPTTTISNDAGCDMTAAYVTQYYQGVGDAMFYGVADNLTTEASGTSVLDAHQGKVLDNKIGALADLETTAKSSAVAAINEVKSETVSLIPTVLFDSPTRVGSGTFAESIYNFERIRIYYKIRYEYGSVDIYTSFISTDGVVDLIGFFDFNNYLGAHLHRINLTDTTFSTVYAYQYFPPSTEKTDVGGDDAIAIYRVEGYRS